MNLEVATMGTLIGMLFAQVAMVWALWRLSMRLLRVRMELEYEKRSTEALRIEVAALRAMVQPRPIPPATDEMAVFEGIRPSVDIRDLRPVGAPISGGGKTSMDALFKLLSPDTVRTIQRLEKAPPNAWERLTEEDASEGVEGQPEGDPLKGKGSRR